MTCDSTNLKTETKRNGEKRHSPLVGILLRLFKEKPLGTVSGIVVVLLFLVGVFANFFAPYGINDVNMGQEFQPPSLAHPLGTDEIGRDELSRIIWGARVTMIVAILGTIISTAVSAAIGMISGYFGGITDLVIQRIVDAIMCFPVLLVLLTIVSLLGAGLFQITLTIGVLFGISGVRVVRSAVMSVKPNAYVEAAVAGGGKHNSILIRHILPNILAPIVILATTRMGAVILSEASLSFLGFGIPPPNPSWGGMLSGPGRQYMYIQPLFAIWPGLFLTISVYGINMFGDALRDILDPRLRGGLGSYSISRGKKIMQRLKAKIKVNNSV